MSKYKLINDDCIHAMQELANENIQVDLILTDPPYGTTNNKWDTIIPFEDMWNCLKDLTKKYTPIVLFGSEPFSTKLRNSKLNWFKYDWIWEKDVHASFGIAKYQPLRYHEIISVFTNGGGEI